MEDNDIMNTEVTENIADTSYADTNEVAEGGEYSEPNESESTEASLPEGKGYAIKLNAAGEREFVRYDSEATEEVEEESDNVDYSADAPQDNQTSSEPYSTDELALAMQLGQVDESRIPREYVGQYIGWKTQAYQQAYQQALQQQAQQQQAVQQQPQVQDDGQTRMDEINKLREQAYELTLQEMNLTADEADLLEYSDEPEKAETFKVALQNNINNILIAKQAQALQARQAQNERYAVYSDIKGFAEEKMRSEPNFQAIDRYMIERADTLPFNQALPIKIAIEAFKNGTATREHLPILEKYYEDTRADFYRRANGLSNKPKAVKKPPRVERTGTGSDSSGRQPATDWSQMRNMTKRDRMAFLQKNFRR